LLAFGRAPTAEEQKQSGDYLMKVEENLAGVPMQQRQRRAWESFARVVFMSNEFVYVN